MTMTMRRTLSKRANKLNVKVEDTPDCASMPISWDASAGQSPWTVMIAPVNEVPYTLSVPEASGSSFSTMWDVPKLKQDTTLLVAVADASGQYSGVSSMTQIKSGTGKCSPIKSGLDFIWYPTDEKSKPASCSDWGVTWDQDNKTGTVGVQGTVSFTILAEGGQPITLNAGSGDHGKYTFTMPVDTDTDFVVVANDEGKYGTGGVGDLYFTALSKKGASTNCKVTSSTDTGLPKPSGTLVAQATKTTNSAGNGSHGKNTASSDGGMTTSTVAALDSHKSASGSSKAGSAVGATFGVLGALALISILVWWLRRRRARKSEEERAWGGAQKMTGGASGNGIAHADKSYPISPWRFSASPYDPPQTTSRTSKWMNRASGASSAAGGFRVLGRSKNDDKGHLRNDSLTTSAQPNMQQAKLRNMSSSNEDYSMNPLPPLPYEHVPRSPSPTHSQRYGAGNQSIHTTVPDTQLFPPPSANPSMFSSVDDSPYGIVRQQQQQRQQYMQPFRPPNGVVHEQYNPQSPFNDPVSTRPLHLQSDIVQAGGAGVGAVGMNMRQQQQQQQQQDPYQHSGPTHEVRQGTSPSTAQNGGGTRGPFADAANGQSSTESPVVSEVMMQSDHGYFANRQGHRPAAEDEDENGLPYL